MKNLYDLLGARPDDDTESLRKAYRKAAKSSHPDHHGGDQDAAAQFRQIAKAYEILRDADQRAAYDRLLEFERRPLHHKLQQLPFDMKRHIVHDLIAGALLAVVLAVGYELFARIPETAGDETAGDKAAGIIVLQMPIEQPTAPAAIASAANEHNRPEITDDEPVSNSAEQSIAVASQDSKSDIPTGDGVLGKMEGAPAVRHEAPSPNSPFSTVEERNGVPAADNRRDGKTPEMAGANTSDVKTPEIKVSARPPKAVKHPAARRPLFEPASPDNKNTSACAGSQSCPVSVPPFFGFGP
jgi:curved DNA-binding protein CbpA